MTVFENNRLVKGTNFFNYLCNIRMPKRYIIIFLSICCLTSRSRIFLFYGDVTITWPELKVMPMISTGHSQGGSFIVPHLLGFRFWCPIRRILPFGRFLRQANRRDGLVVECSPRMREIGDRPPLGQT